MTYGDVDLSCSRSCRHSIVWSVSTDNEHLFETQRVVAVVLDLISGDYVAKFSQDKDKCLLLSGEESRVSGTTAGCHDERSNWRQVVGLLINEKNPQKIGPEIRH